MKKFTKVLQQYLNFAINIPSLPTIHIVIDMTMVMLHFAEEKFGGLENYFGKIKKV